MTSITTRKKNILRILCAEKEFITTVKIVNQLRVSSKIIARELSAIDQWLDKKGILLEKRPGIVCKLSLLIDKENSC